jgi:hypothetical protein
MNGFIRNKLLRKTLRLTAFSHQLALIASSTQNLSTTSDFSARLGLTIRIASMAFCALSSLEAIRADFIGSAQGDEDISDAGLE